MAVAKLRRTRYKEPRFASGTWSVAREVALSPGMRLYYRLENTPAPPEDVIDDRGRSVLEAFGALPMTQMAERLAAGRADLLSESPFGWDQRKVREAISELVTFVGVFGPIGVSFGSEFVVDNPEADSALREVERLKARGLGIDPERPSQKSLEATLPAIGVDPAGVSRASGHRFWSASFWGHGPGRATNPVVRARTSFPGLSWEERVRADDDYLPHDSWSRIVEEHRDLASTLDLVRAIASGDGFRCRHALVAFMAANQEFEVTPPSPWRPDYSLAVIGPLPVGGILRPFTSHLHQVDWIKLGRLFLTNLISRQIDFAMPLVDMGPEGTLNVRWRATSVLEVIYLQLLAHLRKHERFGIGTCRTCGGPILQSRGPGPTANLWHRGCHAGRIGLWRKTKADRARETRQLASPGPD